MIRTQIYLPEEMYKQLKAQSKRQKIAMAKLMRDIIKNGLKNSDLQSNGFVLNDLMEKMQITEGPSDLSKRMDYYLYDEPYE